MKKTWNVPHLEVLDVKSTMGYKGIICTFPPLKCNEFGDGDEGSGDIVDS